MFAMGNSGRSEGRRPQGGRGALSQGEGHAPVPTKKGERVTGDIVGRREDRVGTWGILILCVGRGLERCTTHLWSDQRVNERILRLVAGREVSGEVSQQGLADDATYGFVGGGH